MIRRFSYRNISFKNKLILAFSVFIIIVSILISAVSMTIFTDNLQKKNTRYISDITYQTVNNLEDKINDLDEISFSVLSNSVIQSNLRKLNADDLTGSEQITIEQNIEKELLIHTLYNNDVVSLSVVSDSGIEVVSRSLALEPTKKLFIKKDIYQQNGSTIWVLINDEDKDICVARAILDLTSMKPIGYINLVCKGSYIGNIMKDVTFSYANGSYILDGSGIVISSNKTESIGTTLTALTELAAGSHRMKLNGEASYVFQGETLYNGWTLVTIIPLNELAKETRWFLIIIILLDLIVILFAVAIIWLLVRRITSPLIRLCENMLQVGQGDFSKWEMIIANDEIGMLSRSFNEMVENIERLIDQIYKLDISKRQAELEFLKMQINPHFLYNTLDTISWMARIEQKDEIADVTIALASLLRANIKQDDFIAISEEMHNIENYLLIQHYRFGSKFSSRILVEKECEDYLIPCFILQPLVENAITHGLEPKQTDGKLVISIKKKMTG